MSDGPVLHLKPGDIERNEAMLSDQRTKQFEHFKCPIHNQSAKIVVTINLQTSKVQQTTYGCCEAFKQFIASEIHKAGKDLVITISKPLPDPE